MFSTIHPGNRAPWTSLTHERVLPIVSAIVTLLRDLCSVTELLISTIYSDVTWELHLQEFPKR